ncbi:MAG TPA: metallophosphatase [Flavipsychrobacter sp.]|nr:metallophosphatase [Flavipsychrobacter sp.]
MQDRREFIKTTAIGTTLLLIGSFPFSSLANVHTHKLTILHTNDIHGRIKPFVPGNKFEGLGGAENRSLLINDIRKKEEHVLLLDAGDFLRPDSHSDLYKASPEIELMNHIQYDAATIGDHEFDNGVKELAESFRHINFPLLVANYDFNNTPLEGKVNPYTTIKKGRIKIGIFGLGLQLDSWIPEEDRNGVKYLDALYTAQVVSEKLKKYEECDMIICLSHLGYDYGHSKISDKVIAIETKYIDLIVGGHTHTFLDKPFVLLNKIGKEVVINQVGWGGVKIGRLDYVFDSKKSSKLFNAQSVIVTKQTIA